MREHLQRWRDFNPSRQLLIVLGAFFAVAPASIALAAQTHVVQPGDTLSAIADSYGLTLNDLVTLNGIANPDLIFAGETLKIGADAPPPTPDSTHAVVEGDTLAQIAAKYGVSVESLVEANSLDDANFIYIGQVLLIPAPGPYFDVPDPGPGEGSAPGGRGGVQPALRPSARPRVAGERLEPEHDQQRERHWHHTDSP